MLPNWLCAILNTCISITYTNEYLCRYHHSALHGAYSPLCVNKNMGCQQLVKTDMNINALQGRAGTAAHLETRSTIYSALEWKHRLPVSNLEERLVANPLPRLPSLIQMPVWWCHLLHPNRRQCNKDKMHPYSFFAWLNFYSTIYSHLAFVLHKFQRETLRDRDDEQQLEPRLASPSILYSTDNTIMWPIPVVGIKTRATVNDWFQHEELLKLFVQYCFDKKKCVIHDSISWFGICVCRQIKN